MQQAIAQAVALLNFARRLLLTPYLRSDEKSGRYWPGSYRQKHTL
jgi:hypothetical protein